MSVGRICVYNKGAEEGLHSITPLLVVSFIVTFIHVGGEGKGQDHGNRAVSVSEVGKGRTKQTLPPRDTGILRKAEVGWRGG